MPASVDTSSTSSSAPSSAPVWIITGCSSGIGREIAVAALNKGYRTAVTARDVSRVQDLAAQYPQLALPLALDVTDGKQVAAVVKQTEQKFGQVDVLVNNAGYGYLAAIEEGEDAEVRAMFDTNYFGTVAMIKAVLPGMRRRMTGHIINISSMTGLVSNPATTYYSSTKYAMEALTEGLSKELVPFNIRVSAIEPGAFRTDWSSRSMKETRTEIEAYAATVGVRRKLIKSMSDKHAGDPKLCADAVIMIAGLEKPPLHLLLGRDVYQAFQAKLADLSASIKEWESVTLSTDFKVQ